MFAVILNPTWPGGQFGRTVRTENGEQRLLFKVGEGHMLPPEIFFQLHGDMGKALRFAATAIDPETRKPIALGKVAGVQPELPPLPPPRKARISDADIQAENKRLKSELTKLTEQNGKLQEQLSLAKGATAAAEAKLSESELAEAELLHRVENLEKELAAAKPADPPAGEQPK